MIDLFGEITTSFDEYTLFQDEADCKDSNFFYHGFLFVKNESGAKILNEILEAKGPNSKDSEITFKEIRKDDYRVRIAVEWLKLADKWLRQGDIRFYVLGVNKNNLKNFWDNSWRYDKNIYLRFFEIGLNGAIGWFKNDQTLKKQFKVTHIFYDYGNYNDERKDKIAWLSKLSGHKHVEPVDSDPKRQQKANPKLYETSNFIQLTDILLGVTKYSFIKTNPEHKGKQKCIDSFIEIIERYNAKSAYNLNSHYYKRYSINFFPTKSDITKDEFLSKDWDSIRKRGGFYNARKTYRQTQVENQNLTLF